MAVAPDQSHRSSALLSHLGAADPDGAPSHELEPLGLRPRHLVALTVLRGTGGVTGQQELAAELRVDRTNLVGLLNELEAEGLILRRARREDRRRHIVELTAAGERAPRRRRVGDRRRRGRGPRGAQDRQREQLFELLQQATAGRAPDCAGAAAEREPEC